MAKRKISPKQAAAISHEMFNAVLAFIEHKRLDVDVQVLDDNSIEILDGETILCSWRFQK